MNKLRLEALDLEKCRKELNMTQSDFAGELGISKACYWRQLHNLPGFCPRLLYLAVLGLIQEKQKEIK